MFNTLNITGLEMSAQYAPGGIFSRGINHKPNVDMVTVEYKGGGVFAYYVAGVNGRREISREFAHDILTQEMQSKGA